MLIKHQLRSNFFIISGFHPLFDKEPTISAYESGKTTILTAFAYEICKRYNISMDYLCGRTR